MRAERLNAAPPSGFVTCEVGGDYSPAERERRLQAYERLEGEARMRGRYF